MKRNHRISGRRGLFVPSKRGQNVFLSCTSHDFETYLGTYIAAAWQLLEPYRDGNCLSWHLLPGLFVLRHAIELALKRTIIDGQELAGFLGSSIKPIDLNKHNLETLVMSLEKLFSQSIFKTHAPHILNLKRRTVLHVVELSRLDPSSVAFRYPADLNKRLTLPNEKQFSMRILLRRLHATVEDLVRFSHQVFVEKCNRDPYLQAFSFDSASPKG